ncbi:MAG: radical SAM/SPASM domain-containing protein [Candidatus Micrarchaeota archaeon]
MGRVEINPTFHYKKHIPTEYEQSPEYLEYRRKWEENPKNHVVGAVPIHMDIESTSVCNLKCITCFQSFNPPPKGHMSFNFFKKIIDEGSQKGLCSIKLNYRGEPLLCPDIIKMVSYAKSKGITEVMFNSNCTLLTEKVANELIDAGLDRIICSVDAYEKEVYEKIRIGGNFDSVLNNIKNLQRIKNERGSPKPIVRLQMVDSPTSHGQVEGYIKFWGSIADEVAVTDMCDWHEKSLKSLTVSKEFDCSKPYQRMSVWFNGKVTFCDGNYFGHLDVGDLTKQTIEEVWHGPVMQKIREANLKGESHRIKICAECGFRMTVIKNKNMQKEEMPATGEYIL